MSNISKPTDAEEIDHDSTQGGTDGNPHADSASASDVSDHAADTGAHHARYADSEARSAVDGASVTVDNADNLGGSPPSAYETPAQTQSARVVGGYVKFYEDAGSTTEVELVVDEVAVTNSADVAFRFTDRAEIEITGGGTQTISESYLTEIEVLFAGDANIEVSALSSPTHSHDIQL